MESTMKSVSSLSREIDRRNLIRSLSSNMPLIQDDIELMTRYCLLSSFNNDMLIKHDILTAIEGALPLMRDGFLLDIRGMIESFLSSSKRGSDYCDLIEGIDRELDSRAGNFC